MKNCLPFLENVFSDLYECWSGGPARIRTGDRQVSRTWGYEPAALSVLQPEENLAELRALLESRWLSSILNVLVVSNSCSKG